MNMYEVGSEDRVEQAPDLPQPDAGAPSPVLVADDLGTVNLLFHTSVRYAAASLNDAVAIVRFSGCIAHLLGPPNDEAFAGHPLATRGLTPYGVFRVQESSWVKALERMNRVHPLHRPEAYRERTHYIYTFHDSVFECVAKGAKAIVRGQARGTAIEEIIRAIGGHAA
jgi:hypothetical protein